MNFRPFAFPLLLVSLLSGCVGTDVFPDTVRSILVRTPQTTVRVGDSVLLSVKLVNAFGDEFDAPVQWAISSSGVATLSQSGVLKALAPGQVAVKAVNDSLESEEVLITVFSDANLPAEIIVSGPGSQLEVGGSVTLSAVVRNASGDVLSGLELSWESSHPDIVSVEGNGNVTALQKGEATIVARTGSIQSQSYQIKVGSEALTGTFQRQNGYNVSGGASLAPTATGLVINLLDNFLSQSGPGLYVYLSDSPISVNGGVEIAKLRKTSGADSYVVPAGVTLDEFDYILIHCKPFNVTFGAAKIQ
ncbi:MAG: hypothetical protein EAZ89_02020 [Bacteroidetes bacterium]|nr:MAG: hypothetical protein EAZ89_02020 [Bacteroidota bacterium]